MKKNQVWQILSNQYTGVNIVPPTTAALAGEKKQEDKHYRG